MQVARFMKRSIHPVLILLLSALYLFHPLVYGAETLSEAISNGQMKLDMRYRYEIVEENNANEDASASTLRTRLGYLTDPVRGLAAYLEFEDTAGVMEEDYNSVLNGKTNYSTVADPELTEVNQAYVSYAGWQDAKVTFGRQRIILDNARFVGNVGWRQNEQTFDALSLKIDSLPDTALTYAYVGNINTITGGNTDTETHLVNAVYSGLGIGKLTPYAYLLDTVDSTADSQTLGLRFSGATDMAERIKLLYTAEFAQQSDYADAPSSVDADYAFAELGVAVSGVTIKLGSETLGGDGVYAFQTPLATKHAFNGWADKFLATPADGLNDTMFTVATKYFGAKLMAVYHDFSADNGSADYGTELDLLAVKKLDEHYTLGLKYAGYDADTFSVDTDKIWFWAQAAY